MNVVFARLHLEAWKEESLPVGGLADMVKRFGLHTQPQEVFWVIANDANGNVRTIVEVGRGGHDQVAVDIPAAMRAVLVTGASAFSVAHNHPTLSVLPSAADQNLTHAMMNAANSLGLLFEDHVIVDPTGASFSFRDGGLIDGVTPARSRRKNSAS